MVSSWERKTMMVCIQSQKEKKEEVEEISQQSKTLKIFEKSKHGY